MANEAGFIQMISGAYTLGIAGIVGFGVGVAEGSVSQGGGDPLALDIALGAIPVLGAYGGFQVGYAMGDDHEPLDCVMGTLGIPIGAAIVAGSELAGYAVGALAYGLFN